jgi:hypothetical protein
MKTKILPIHISKNGSENLKKMEMLSEKLAKYFKVRLATLMEEKDYKYSHLIFDINSYWRTMEGFGIETESIVPKMEKYLIEKISKSKIQYIRNEVDLNINNNLKDEGNLSVKNSEKRIINLQNINRNFISYINKK